MEEELEETSLRPRSAASRHHHQRRRAKKPPPTTNYDDVFGGPPRHAVPFSGVPDDYAEVFGGVSVSCSIPFLDLPAGQMDGWDCATGESVNGVDYGEIFGRCDFGDFAVPYEELFGRGKRDEREMDMHVASSNGRSSIKDRSGPQIIDPSAFVQEYSNEDCIPYLEDALFSSSPVDSDEIPKEYNTSYNKSIRTQAKELLHTTASVPQPQTGFTYVVEPTKPPEEPPLFNDDTVTHGNSVRPNPRSSEEPVSPEVPFLSVNDMNLQIRSAKPPPPARPPTPKFLVNERQKINTFAKTDSVSQQEEPKPFLKSDSLPPNFDFVPNLKLDKREKPKLKSNPKIFSKSDSLPPSFGSELDAMKEAMEFAQARLKTAKELHEKKREGKITELPLKKRHVKDESLEGSEGVRPRVLRSVSLASNFNNGGEFMKEQGSGVAATQAVHELEKSGKWRSDDEFYVLTSIEPEKEREIKVGITGIEPLGEAERELVQIGGMPPTEMELAENLNADVNETENLEVLGEIEFEEDLKREEKTTIVPSLIQNNLELEKETGEDKTEASKDDSNRVQNVEDRENTGDVQVGTEEGKGSEMEVGAETEEEGKRRSEMEWELERENVKRLEEERERERKREELEKERQREKEIEEEKERAHKLEEETDRAVKLEEETDRAVKLEEEKGRAVKLEEEKEMALKLEEKEMARKLEEEKEMARKLEEERERKLQMDKESEEKERVEMERIMIEERERLERERLKKLEEESERERLEKEREREEDMQRKLEQEREKERKLEEERQQEKEREKEMVKKLEEEKERERKLEEEIEKEREMVRKLVEEREQERERVRKLEEEKERERDMARKLKEEKERERKLEEEIEKERGRVKKLEEEREWERERVRILEEERELERERVRKLEEEREQDRERVRELEEEREKQMIEKEREWKERDRIEREREQKERERIEKEREQKEEEKKLEEEREKQRKEKEEGEKQRRMEKEREEKEMALRLEAERRRFERERAEERERMTKLRGEKTKERKSDEERERGRRMKERERKTEGRKSDEEGEKARERKSDEERERERERRARKEREREKEEREREREKDRLAMERATQERAERIAIERITAARQRALLENRDKEETSNRGAGEGGYEKKRVKGEEEKKEREGERNAREARLRAERAAVERATAEARERAIEKAKAEAGKERDRLERFKSFNMSSSQSQDTQESHFKRTQSDSALIHDDGESALRHKARLERQQRTAERAAKALAEKNRRDIMAQREQAERDRMAEHLDADVKRWSSGKEGNLRALLSTLQYILGQNSGWQPIHLTEVITAADVKKAYRKATLYVHPDKLQQRGASIQHKYICEKVFDLLKEAWNKFNSEER